MNTYRRISLCVYGCSLWILGHFHAQIIIVTLVLAGHIQFHSITIAYVLLDTEIEANKAQ